MSSITYFDHEGILELARRLLMRAFDDTPLTALSDLDGTGAGRGVYALYYCGKAPHYRMAGLVAMDRPIYIGKAVRGSSGVVGSVGQRLIEHRDSISSSINLAPRDFCYKTLLLRDEDYAQALALEQQLIDHYKPLWNLTMKGFGNHAPGAGRPGLKPSDWDRLHPGRPWVRALEGPARIEDLIEKVAVHARTFYFNGPHRPKRFRRKSST